jgi:uncharacterized membrane protein SpoIIM required for sporulation
MRDTETLAWVGALAVAIPALLAVFALGVMIGAAW